jgi:hypothetical protein
MLDGFAIVLIVAALFAGLQAIAMRNWLRDTRQSCRQWISSCRDGRRRLQPRESAIADLERQLATSFWSTLLRRLGIVAPLVGVILTVGSIILGGDGIGSLFAPPDSGKSFGSDPLSASFGVSRLAPLLAGVAAGALLAILNQVLCAFATYREERAVALSTEAVSGELFRDTDYRLEDVVAGIERAGTRLAAVSEGLSQMLAGATGSIESVRSNCESSASLLSGAARGLQEALVQPIQVIAASATAVRDSMERLSSEVGTSSVALARSAGSAASALERSVEEHRRTMSSLEKLFVDLDSAARQLKGLSSELSSVPLEAFSTSLRDATASVGSQSLQVVAALERIGDIQSRWQVAVERMPGISDESANKIRRMEETVSRNEDATRRLVDEYEALGTTVTALVGSLRVAQAAVSAGGVSASGEPNIPRSLSRGLFSAARGERAQ